MTVLVIPLMSELTDIELKLAALLEHYDKTIQERFERLEGQLEILERMLATLIPSYSEMASMIESLIAVVVNNSEEQRKEFHEALQQSRSNMIKLFKQSNEAVNPQDKFVATSQPADR